MELKRINAKDRETLVNLCAVECLMRYDAEQFKLLSNRVPNAWRDYRMVQTTLDRLSGKLLATVPPEQLATILKHTQNAIIKVAIKGINDQPEDNWVISRTDLELLINSAAEGKCLMCTNITGQGCQLRRIIEESPMALTGLAVGCLQ